MAALDAEGIARALGSAQPSGNGWKARCPSHADENPSLSISDGENGRVLLHCHAGCSQSEVIAALVALGLWPNGTRSKRSTEKTPIIPVPADAPPMSFKHPKNGAPSRVWPYHLADGRLAGYIARFDFVNHGVPRKDCLPITYCDLGDGKRGWRAKGIPEPRPLYRLPELLARAGAPILVTEGEKAADAAQRLFPDYAVTTPMHGARSPAKTDWTPVKGRSVTIWPDRDQPGADFARLVAELADEAGGTTVSIVAVPAEFPEGWDLADQPPANWTIERLRGLLEAAPAWKPEAEPCARPTDAQRRMIRVMRGDIAEATEASLRVLAGETDPFAAVYARSNLLVRPIRIRDRLEAGGIRRSMEALILHVVDTFWLCLRLAQLADFYVVRYGTLQAVDPPGRLCQVVLAAAPWKHLPTLTGIIEAPTILPTGSVIQTLGYDARTGLLFDPGNARFPPIPTKPSREQAEAALRTLAEPFEDFPFIDDPSRSVALAAVLTVLVRRCLRAAPLFAYDAPKMASGKTLLITVVSYIATGRGPYLLSQVTDPTDERKRLLATLLEGPAVVVIDNVEHPLKSDALCTALTEPSFTDRLLGVSKTATAATNVTFAATGNNLVIAGDLSARSLLCRLDPGVERPEEREFARDLHSWVPAHRGALAVAALTIIAAYLAEGAPRLPVKNFARFEDWQRLCRFPLIWLGLADPCATRDNIEASDPEREKLRVLLTAWHEHFGERIVTIKEVISAATANEALRDAIEMAVPPEKGGVFSSLKLAKFIGRFVRRIEGGLRFERAADDTHDKVARWSVKRVESAGDAGVCGCSSSPYAREQKTDEGTFSKNDSRTGWENPRKHPQPPQDPPSNEAVFAAIAAAAKAGAAFRLSGNRVEISGLEKVEQADPAIAAFLRENPEAIFDALGGNAADAPSLALIEALGVEIAYCADDSTAAAAIVEVFADAGGRPIAIDVETAALPEYADYPPIRLTIAGRPIKVQPRSDNHAALDPHRSGIRLVQLYGGGQRVAVFDMRSVSWPVLAPVWERPLVAHNAAFELKFLAAVGIKPRLQCTEQAVKLLSGVPEGGIWGLADACQTYLGIAVPKTHQTSDWAAPELSPGQLAYAAADAVLCGRLWARVGPQLKAANRDAAYRLQRDSLPVAAAMEWRGIGIDRDVHAKLCNSWRASRESAAGAWSESMGRPLPEKPSDIAAYLAEILDGQALSSWPRTKTGILSTKTAQLEKVWHLPGVASLLRIKETDKLLKAFGEPLRKLVNPVTRRLHPHFKVAAAKSGRWSANGPNIQQLPNDVATRGIIVAAPGRVLVSVDYSQMELRAAAWISGDPELTRAYEEGLDVHAITAAAIAGVPVEAVTKEQRTAAKAANFGLIYGSGPAGLVASAWANYGIEMTVAEAATIRDRFFTKYRPLGQWMRQHADRCQSEGRIVIGAGRVIEAAWEPSSIRYTLACNAPIQGACADCTMRAVIAVHQRMPGILVAQIHDELLAEVPEDKAEEAVVVLEEAMIEAFTATFPGAPTRDLVDAKIGRNWAEVH